MASQLMKARQTRYAAYATVYIIVVIAVLAAINFLADRYNKSYDATANKRYSLSDQTIKIVKDLKQDVKFSYFDDAKGFAGARDLLDRYKNLSSKIDVQYLDILKNAPKARALGARNGSLFLEVGTKREQPKSLTEEEVTSALIRALKTGEKTVCFTSGNGEPSLDESGRGGYSDVKDGLQKNNYPSKSINLLEKPVIPPDCSVVVASGARTAYLPAEVEALKKYVEGGGRALFMIDPPLQVGKEQIAENAELLKLLAEWGVTVEKNLLLDTSGVGPQIGLSELVSLVTSFGTHPIVSSMRRVGCALPLARSVDGKSAGKVTVEKLFSTSSDSYATTTLNAPSVSINPEKDKQGPFNLGVAGVYNTGNKDAGGKNVEGRFVVVGSSEWIQSGLFRSPSFGNRDLFLNIMNWLSSDEDLISIRPKDPEDRRLTISGRQLNVLALFSVIILPLLVAVAGFGVWWRRR